MTYPLREIILQLTLKAQGLPEPQRFAPRHTKAGTLDLTASMLFVQDVEWHGRVASCANDLPRRVKFGTGELNLKSAMTFLLKLLHQLSAFWRQKDPFRPSDLLTYRKVTEQFGALWKALGWKVSTWVHWVVRHSCALADLHLNFYIFSSIPIERRNVEFKLDVTHCYKGWKISRPYACTFGFGHVLNLAALDIGLLLHVASNAGKKRSLSDDE